MRQEVESAYASAKDSSCVWADPASCVGSAPTFNGSFGGLPSSLLPLYNASTDVGFSHALMGNGQEAIMKMHLDMSTFHAWLRDVRPEDAIAVALLRLTMIDEPGHVARAFESRLGVWSGWRL